MVFAIEINPTTFPAAKFGNIGLLLNVIIPLLILGAALLFFVMLLWAGFTLLTSAGNPEKIKKAQGTLGFAILGLVIVISSFLIVKIIGYILNISGQIKL